MENQNIMPQQEPAPGLFGKPQQPAGTQRFSEEVTSTLRRLRVLEERYSTLHRKTQVYEQNFLIKNKKLSSDIKMLSAEIKDMKKDMNDIKDKIRMFVAELQTCAKREEVNILKRYINLWEPLNFITRNELQKILDDVIEEKLSKLNIKTETKSENIKQ